MHQGLSEPMEAGKTTVLPRWFARACTRAILDGRIAYPVLAAVLIVGLQAQLASLINHDTAWYLHAGARFLDGGRLYQDVFVDINPPLGIYLTVPPVALARLTGLFAVDVFVVYFYALIALSLAATWWLLRASPALPVTLRRGLVFAAALILTVSPADQFGQREHFLVVLALPYLVLLALRADGARCAWPLAAFVGAAAALGFALKPHYILVPLGLEIYLLAARRRPRLLVRPEALALAATGVLYAASVLAFTPDYPFRIARYALEVYNDAYRNPLWINLFRGETLLLPLACLIQLSTRRSQKHPLPGDVFLTASTAFFVAYVAQMKGWDYHLYPAATCMTLGYAALFLNGLESFRGGASATRPGPVLVLALLVAAIVPVAGDAWRGGYRNAFMDMMMPHVERHAAGGSIAILTSNVWPGFPMVNYAGVGWSSRFPTLWLLPGALRRRQGAEGRANPLLDEIERYTRDAVVEDFTRRPPALVIVDNREQKSYFGGLEFDYVEYFLQDPRFASLWAEYEWIGDEGDYRLYRRRCAPDC